MWVALLAVIALAAQSSARVPDVVSFTLHRGHLVIVTGSVGSLTDLTLVLDTGSGRTVLASSLAATLRLKGRPTRLAAFGRTVEAEETVAPAIKVAGFVATAHPVVVADLGATAVSLRLARMDGIIGIDLVRTRSFGIDYGRRLLLFGSRPSASNRVPFAEHPFLVVLTAAVDGRAVRLSVDTGASHLVLFSDQWPGPSEPSASAAQMSGTSRVGVLDVGELRIGRWRIRRPAAVTAMSRGNLGTEGLLGIPAFGAPRYVEFDFDRREFGWTT
jgi:hypothetical protein